MRPRIEKFRSNYIIIYLNRCVMCIPRFAVLIARNSCLLTLSFFHWQHLFFQCSFISPTEPYALITSPLHLGTTLSNALHPIFLMSSVLTPGTSTQWVPPRWLFGGPKTWCLEVVWRYAGHGVISSIATPDPRRSVTLVFSWVAL